MKRKLARGLIAIIGLWIGLKVIVPKPKLVIKSSFSQAVYDKDGQLLRLSLSSDEKYRLWTPLQEISASLIRGTLLQEDRYFYFHPGVNPWSLIRSTFLTFFGGERRYGASTLTMQLARMRFGINSRSILGKLEQITRALQLEFHYSKKEILEAYLNLAPYGGNVEGVGAASLVYFGKRAKLLSIPEAFTLCVVPQNPSKRSPAQDLVHLKDARQRLVAEANYTIGLDELNQLSVPFAKRDLPFKAPHFVNRVLDRHPFVPEIQSTLDSHLQTMLERQLSDYLERNRRLGLKNAAILLADSRTMNVRAYVGSADYFDPEIEGFVDGITGRRSPGSALKPFIYALSAEHGLIHSQSLLKDVAFARATYNPENFDKEFLGPLSATEALIRSRNSPAISLLNALPAPGLYGFLKSAGVKEMRDESYYGLSLALGGVEVRLDELLTLYGLLNRGGSLRSLRFAESEAVGADTPLLSAESTELVREMLAHNPRPGRDIDPTRAGLQNVVPWKTGTSFGFRDAWSLGFIGPYVLGVWVGNFNGQTNPALIGRDAAGPLFFSIADALIADGRAREVRTVHAKLNISRVKVCAISGDLPSSHCHELKDANFIPGVSPIKTCAIHREVAIDPRTGFRTCSAEGASSGTEIKQVFEFWPSDLLSLFRQAGLPRRIPPQLDPSCQFGRALGARPQILSPRNGLDYLLRVKESPSIPLQAVIPADARRVFWFVDDASVGVSQAGETLFWKAWPGEFVVRAVDDQGRSNSINVKVALVP